MTIAFYTLDGTPNPSPEAEDNSSSSIFTKADINASTAEAWGWKIFEKEIDSEWMKIKTINIASVLTDEEFSSFCKYTQSLTNCNLDCFFNLCAGQTIGEAVDEYRVFTFAIDQDVTCLSSLPSADKQRYCLDLYKNLLEIIRNYRKSPLWTNAKIPLNCICESNIYLHTNRSKGYIEILPAANISKINERDTDSDLYDAAYLYLQMKYPDNQPFDDSNETDRFIERCLSQFESRRPTLEALLDHLNGTSSKNETEEEKPDKNNNTEDDTDIKTIEGENEGKETENAEKIVASALSKLGKKLGKFIFGSGPDTDTGTDDTLEG